MYVAKNRILRPQKCPHMCKNPRRQNIEVLHKSGHNIKYKTNLGVKEYFIVYISCHMHISSIMWGDLVKKEQTFGHRCCPALRGKAMCHQDGIPQPCLGPHVS